MYKYIDENIQEVRSSFLLDLIKGDTTFVWLKLLIV